METNKTRRAAIAIFGTAVVAAFTELRPALATKGGYTTTGTGGGSCRNEGGNCSGNQTCCKGLTCTPTGNGNSKVCKGSKPEPEPDHCNSDRDCPSDCTCESGGCYPKIEYANCVEFEYKEQTQVCNTRYGRRKRVNCKQFNKKSGRQRCQRRNARLQRQLTTCTTNSKEFAYAQCEYLRVS